MASVGLSLSVSAPWEPTWSSTAGEVSSSVPSQPAQPGPPVSLLRQSAALPSPLALSVLTRQRAPAHAELGPAEFGEGVSLTDTAKEIGAQFGVRSLRVLADLSICATLHTFSSLLPHFPRHFCSNCSLLRAAEDVDRITEEIVAEYGRIDILVHNAGGDIAADGGKADPSVFTSSLPLLVIYWGYFDALRVLTGTTLS